MNKANFCRIINELREGERLQDKVASAVRQYNNIVHSDYPEPFGMVISHSILVVELLAEIMDDKMGDIEFFCYELDFGRKYEPGMITDEEGNGIDLSSPERLYDTLIDQKNKRKKEYEKN